MADRCRGCGAEMRWAITENGKRVPIDPEPIETGNLIMTAFEMGGELHVKYVKRGETSDRLAPRYLSHFVTCPKADEFRNKKRASEPEA